MKYFLAGIAGALLMEIGKAEGFSDTKIIVLIAAVALVLSFFDGDRDDKSSA